MQQCINILKRRILSKVMEKIILREEFIKLGQALKAAGLVDSGIEAKEVIIDGKVSVNGKVEIQRGKKLYDGDIVEYNNEIITITK
jgi:ribosome-associated protein